MNSETILFNLGFAVAIGSIIAVMALLKHTKTKALVYSLPISASLALIATEAIIDTSHIIGLVLINLFLWSVAYLHRRKVNIVVADILMSIAYIAVGYVLITNVGIPFYAAVLGYIVLWVLFMMLYREKKFREPKHSPKHINPIIKFPIITVVAFTLLSVKSLLSGIIVTFPFSGVFAVVEMRKALIPLAAMFTHNSIALLFLFCTLYITADLTLPVKLAVAWVVYLVCLELALKFVPFKKYRA